MDKYYLTHLKWPFGRKGRAFRVRVVEPREYDPETHGSVFEAVVADLVQPAEPKLDTFSGLRLQESLDFDLVTFPEAFVTSRNFIETLRAVERLEPTGCFHVGLRPSTDKNHLFSRAQVETLVSKLLDDFPRASEDLETFKVWFDGTKANDMTNLACLFMVDTNGELRISLQPKMVRSRFERNALPEEHLAESTLLTVITLVPTEKQFTSINLQPMVCSDATNLETNRAAGGPLRVLNQGANLLDGEIPDHIDVVSVVTCTPQRNISLRDESKFRYWHERFRGTFVAAQEDYKRHHYAVFVLSNFQALEDRVLGGVSGVFIPVTPKREDDAGIFAISCYGRPDGNSDSDPCYAWSNPDHDALNNWKNIGFTASLKPWDARDERVRIFQGDIDRLPREHSLWKTRDGLSNCTIRVGRQMEDGTIEFAWVTDHD